ncbi:triose-phosphate isomerase [Liquorilactobacillus satsumensis]|uniref:Triosephosphate isomerase n=1 Tax=Liquorilactobacillus satsumensis DSM 16230 = JCM 12392 TaxID=1423801 RepID=A0A0R1V444_9LACO|nr:triose-phosphate isomerase [Liquorilactobacillus satsumensis]KRL97810.1 triosephosphate isomerase [Liquorilactobacillus satsumensis DSM 16230 = JCM 12392]MCP9329313.1 triose-phosphate isomerase [Liquorilactobacillus satsumensis]MCP9357394.1 triose-phosphate isomerase [Liquorilactobacillus satsumensis]MCP9371222.1 triose-phosphate isomerase [Liquorilactobacillus satsumensis]
MKKFKKPFFMVNPKTYLYGNDVLRLAELTEKVAAKYDIESIFTAQLIDIPEIKKHAYPHLLITAQHMDTIPPNKGMGSVLPEALKAYGVDAVILNHSERQLTLSQLDAGIKRAKKVGLLSIACADTLEQCQAVAQLHPNAMICEPAALVGSGKTSGKDYVTQSIAAVHAVDPAIFVIEAAGVSTAADVTQMLEWGAAGTGGASGIVKAEDWEAKLNALIGALAHFKK